MLLRKLVVFYPLLFRPKQILWTTLPRRMTKTSLRWKIPAKFGHSKRQWHSRSESLRCDWLVQCYSTFQCWLFFRTVGPSRWSWLKTTLSSRAVAIVCETPSEGDDSISGCQWRTTREHNALPHPNYIEKKKQSILWRKWWVHVHTTFHASNLCSSLNLTAISPPNT